MDARPPPPVPKEESIHRRRKQTDDKQPIPIIPHRRREGSLYPPSISPCLRSCGPRNTHVGDQYIRAHRANADHIAVRRWTPRCNKKARPPSAMIWSFGRRPGKGATKSRLPFHRDIGKHGNRAASKQNP